MSHCGECRHWGAMQSDYKSGDYVAKCLINPPVFVFGVDRGCWPVTEMYDRCSQYAEAEPVSNKLPDDHVEGDGCKCIACLPF